MSAEDPARTPASGHKDQMNYLRSCFEIFCANEPTFSIAQIDAGKIVCIAMPQKSQSERLYINTIPKLSYYFHALNRFDKPAEEREKDKLIFICGRGPGDHHRRESAFADYRARGSSARRAPPLLATQAYSPFSVPSIGVTQTCSCSI